MTTFYSSIQSFFKAEYGGRYLALLIAEVCRVDPSPFKRYFARQFRDARYLSGLLDLDPEYAFAARKGWRRADLAVILDGRLMALLELKFNDKLSSETTRRPAQLSDYLYICRKRKLDFLLLSREPPTATEDDALRRHGQYQVHFSRLAEHLRTASHPASLMLFEYLKEKELTMQPLNEDHLYRFFHRILKRSRYAGRINSKDSLSEGPAQFQALLSNMRLLAADLSNRVRPQEAGARNRAATIDFQFDPYFEIKALKRDIEEQDDDGDEIVASEKARRGGRVFVYAMHSIGGESKKWLYIEYGIGFNVRPGRHRTLSPYVFAQVYGQGFVSAGVNDLFQEKATRFSTLAKPERRGEVLRALLRVIRRSAKSASSLRVITREGRAALRKIAKG